VWKQLTATTYVDQIRSILQNNRDVTMLVWDTSSALSADVVGLLEQARENPNWGKLDVRVSGTNEGDESLMHFIVAKSRDDMRWLVRVEAPHRPFSDLGDSTSLQIPAALFFGGLEAEKTGRTGSVSTLDFVA
jgi:hypothetical protein